MAFSYSDKNFTVVGNLCFVHINVKSKNVNYYIPQAIADRMLIKRLACTYLSYNDNTVEIANAIIINGVIRCKSIYDEGYLYCYFPIDSNK